MALKIKGCLGFNVLQDNSISEMEEEFGWDDAIEKIKEFPLHVIRARHCLKTIVNISGQALNVEIDFSRTGLPGKTGCYKFSFQEKSWTFFFFSFLNNVFLNFLNIFYKKNKTSAY